MTAPGSAEGAAGQARPPARSPEGFYGWHVVAASSLAVVLTAPGQTAAVSVFIEPMLAGLELSRTALSSYLPAFFAAGALCLAAALLILSLGRPSTREVPAGATGRA